MTFSTDEPLHRLGDVLHLVDDGEVTGYGEIARSHTTPGKPRATEIFDSPQQLHFAIETLYEDTVLPAMANGLAGCFYSQLTDVGSEVSGLLSFDRKICKLAPRQVKKIFAIRF